MEIEYQLERIKKALLNYFDFVKRKKEFRVFSKLWAKHSNNKTVHLRLKAKRLQRRPSAG
jgi:hypothetical protein